MTVEQLKSVEFKGRGLTKLNIFTALSDTDNECHVPLITNARLCILQELKLRK
jgi:hypothetical protein